MLETLARTQPSRQSSELVERYRASTRDLLAPLGVTADEAEELLRALSQLRYGALGSKQRIAARKLLRVGTTGDYAPFSLAGKSALRGADIALAQGLARALGVEVRFVRTRWSSLMQDYARGAFELAASGISITPERSAVARFSLPYHHGGKTAIARCKGRDKLDTLAEIDQPNVRVIVNPGGTNEAFARARLTHAALRVFPDNRAIFAELVAGRADVMITDDVEVALQIKLHPELCRTTPEIFAPGDKAWLVQPDPELIEAVNSWLKGEIESGRVERALNPRPRGAGHPADTAAGVPPCAASSPVGDDFSANFAGISIARPPRDAPVAHLFRSLPIRGHDELGVDSATGGRLQRRVLFDAGQLRASGWRHGARKLR